MVPEWCLQRGSVGVIQWHSIAQRAPVPVGLRNVQCFSVSSGGESPFRSLTSGTRVRLPLGSPAKSTNYALRLWERLATLPRASFKTSCATRLLGPIFLSLLFDSVFLQIGVALPACVCEITANPGIQHNDSTAKLRGPEPAALNLKTKECDGYAQAASETRRASSPASALRASARSGFG